jgi:TetR/AcrR family transcriptional regulator
MADKPRRRLSSEDRRESILAAATIVFGERGYEGTSTDAIAAMAGISQAYVIRMFGSKEGLFVEAAARDLERAIEGFRGAIASVGPDAELAVKVRAMGDAFESLLADRGVLLTLMHFNTLGHHPRLGPLARASHMRIYRVIRDEGGIPPHEAMLFLARGMLIGSLLAVRLPDAAPGDTDVREHLAQAFGIDEDKVVALVRLQPPLPMVGRG